LLLLLAALPYVGALAVYWLNADALFRDAGATAPSNWNWRLVTPVMVGGLTPLALAAKSGLPDEQRWLLLSATGLAILYTLISMGIFRDSKKFFQLQLPAGMGNHTFRKWPKWRAFLLVGSLVLIYAAVVNMVVAVR
jgi:hypothetical protein